MFVRVTYKLPGDPKAWTEDWVGWTAANRRVKILDGQGALNIDMFESPIQVKEGCHCRNCSRSIYRKSS